MLIQAVCKRHPDETVVMLAATTAFLGSEKQNVAEDSEQVAYVELDEYNLYCSKDTEHEEGDVKLVVVENGPLQTLATFIDNGVVRPAGDI